MAVFIPEFLSTWIMAKTFNRPERTIRNWVPDGNLQPVQVGRPEFFRETERSSYCSTMAGINEELFAKHLSSARVRVVHSAQQKNILLSL
jgi:hypothetical protein